MENSFETAVESSNFCIEQIGSKVVISGDDVHLVQIDQSVPGRVLIIDDKGNSYNFSDISGIVYRTKLLRVNRWQQ